MVSQQVECSVVQCVERRSRPGRGSALVRGAPGGHSADPGHREVRRARELEK